MSLSWEEAFRTRDGLRGFLGAMEGFFNEQGSGPKPESRASSEESGFRDSEAVQTAYSQATMLIEFSADHEFALINTLKNPGQAFAPWTLMRAVIESSAIACWLLDLSIDAECRVKRSIAFRRQGMQDQIKFLRSASLTDGVTEAKAKLNGIDQKAKGLGFKPVYSKSGELLGYGERLPAMSELTAEIFKTGQHYRLFSSILHGRSWACVALGSRRVDEKDPRVLEKHLEPAAAVLLIARAALYFSMPVWRQAKLYSYDTAKLETLLEGAFDTMGLTTDREFRFWRNQRS